MTLQIAAAIMTQINGIIWPDSSLPERWGSGPATSTVPESEGVYVDVLGASIRIECFGTFKVIINGRAVNRWRAGKARQLFQYLLINRGRVMSRDLLYESLWPDSTLKQSSSLKVAVHMLRSTLEEDSTGPEDSSLKLITHENGYLLEARNIWLDTEAFASQIDQARSAYRSGNPDQAAASYRAALDLYRGDYLPDVQLEWAATEREWLRSRALIGLQYFASAYLEDCDYLAAIDACRRMLMIEPYHEETYRKLILLHGRLGELGQARRWYELCVRRLREELHVAPEESTVRLFRDAMRRNLTLRTSQRLPSTAVPIRRAAPARTVASVR